VERVAAGLPADWLNGWLAAVGVTVLLPNTRLGWTDDPIPFARFDGPPDLPSALWAALPSRDDLSRLATAGHERRVSLDAYRTAARSARSAPRGADWSLGSTLSDLREPLPLDGCLHSPLDPGAPRGITFTERVVACRDAVKDADQIAASLDGTGRRVVGMGLGFDVRRMRTGEQTAKLWIDPVVEMLAWAGMAFAPFRGNGFKCRARGWGTGGFGWCAWSPMLGRWAIDTLLDELAAVGPTPASLVRLGVTGRWESVAFEASPSDATRAFGSRRIGSSPNLR
jgi:hypothetical protein